MQKYETRNRVIECIKLLAACFVVFAHILFPGTFGKIIDGTARLAVPYFFAVSGFFSSQIQSQHVLNRIIRVLKLLLLSTALYTMWDIIKIVFYNNGSLSKYMLSHYSLAKMARWLFLNVNPVAHHLWFLSALITCYAIFYLYVKLNENEKKSINYQPFYIFGFLLLMMHFLVGLKMTGTRMRIDIVTYRNGLFFGLPLFCTGLYIKENCRKIHTCFKLSKTKSLLMFILGTALGVFQYIKLGRVEMPVGSFFAVCALLMLATEIGKEEKPSQLKDRIAYIIGKTSMVVYIIQLMCDDIIKTIAKTSHFWQSAIKNQNIYPLIVLCFSLIIGLFVSLAWYSYKKRQPTTRDL